MLKTLTADDVYSKLLDTTLVVDVLYKSKHNRMCEILIESISFFNTPNGQIITCPMISRAPCI
jgi:hypothetical protein